MTPAKESRITSATWSSQTHPPEGGIARPASGMKGRGSSKCQQGQILLQQGSSWQHRISLVTG